MARHRRQLTYRRPRLTAARQQLRSRQRRLPLQQEATRRRPRPYDVICMEDDEEASASPAQQRPRATLAEILIASLL